MTEKPAMLTVFLSEEPLADAPQPDSATTAATDTAATGSQELFVLRMTGFLFLGARSAYRVLLSRETYYR
jgi:hypothetical protein